LSKRIREQEDETDGIEILPFREEYNEQVSTYKNYRIDEDENST